MIAEGGAGGGDAGREFGAVEWLFCGGCVLLGHDVVDALFHDNVYKCNYRNNQGLYIRMFMSLASR